MALLALLCWLSWVSLSSIAAQAAALNGYDGQERLRKPQNYRKACPDYGKYSAYSHRPLSQGPLRLPYQRPAEQCRTFQSEAVEEVILDMTQRMQDQDLARLFENAFPNTLDTTIRWHVDGSETREEKKIQGSMGAGKWQGPQSFIVTGDINAEWLRDSTNQLLQYQGLANKDPKIHTLILGAINTQTEYMIESPYCNAFLPPRASRLHAGSNSQDDSVHPIYEPSSVFECKYELDSLANFLSLANTFYNQTGSTEFMTPRWYRALDTLMIVLDQQSESTFDEITGKFQKNPYTFERVTTSSTETLNLGGIGNPINFGTGLIRSAFRPSDDAAILEFLVPSNAMMCVELRRTAALLVDVGKVRLSQTLSNRAKRIEEGMWEYGVVETKRWGRVFAYEVDGYGSHILMDDANVPSLLSLPHLGFVDKNDDVYKNTREMLLSREGNPYLLEGRDFKGIGGPHIGPQHAWPMSRLIQALTSEDDAEITECLTSVLHVSKLGLLNESVNVNRVHDYTRSWFAWANSVFAQLILDLARRKPHLLFGEGAVAHAVDQGRGQDSSTISRR